MYAAVRLLDRFLSRLYHVYSFTDDPDCVFRVSVVPAPHDMAFPRASVAAGAPVVWFHLINDKMPTLPPEGADLKWARTAHKLLLASLAALAVALRARPDLQPAEAVYAVTILGTTDGSGTRQLFERLGFTIVPHRGSLGKFGEFWENLYSWWLLGAYNPASRRNRRLLSLQRIELWMPREEFLSRFSPADR